MAYPSSSPAAFSHGPLPTGTSGFRRPATSPCAPQAPGCMAPRSSENEHQLEKLEFALAVAITRGDAGRIQSLREQIAALGGNCEEPGT
jgi:hypothetical protein